MLKNQIQILSSNTFKTFKIQPFPLRLNSLEISNNFAIIQHVSNKYFYVNAGADPGFDQGGPPDRDRPKLPTVRSSVVQAKRALFSVGSALGPRKLLGMIKWTPKIVFVQFILLCYSIDI